MMIDDADRRKLLTSRLAEKGIFAPVRSALVSQGELASAPAGFGQQRLWFLSRLHPDSSAYHVGWSLVAAGVESQQQVEAALQALAARHAILRTTYAEDGQGLTQIIHAALPLQLRWVDGDAGADDLAWLQQMPFDLEQGPVWRALVQLGRSSRIAICAHHIAVDAVSISVLERDLKALLTDVASLPQAPRLSYADFTCWQKARAEEDAARVDLDWWRARLTPLPMPLQLPVDRTAQPGDAHRAGLVSFGLAPGLGTVLAQFAAQQGATPFQIGLAAFKMLLVRLCGQTDILVGVGMDGRDEPELAEIVGFFINTLALRTQLEGDPDLVQALAQTRATVIEAMARQATPFEHIVEAVVEERTLGEQPLLRVVYACREELQATSGQFAAGIHDGVSSPNANAKFDLAFTLMCSGEHLQCWFEYSTDVLAQATVERMARHFGRLLEQALAQPRQPLSGLALLDPGEQAQLQQWGAGEPAAVRDDVCTQFQAQAARTPAALAVADDSTTLDYAGLDAASGRVAAHLSALGVGRGAVVALALPRSVALCVAQLAVLKVGAAFMPLDLQQPRARMWSTILDAKVAAVLGLNEEALEAPADAPRCVLLERDAAVIAGYAPLPATAVTPADLAYVIHTSGSSGKPKGVEVEHRALSSLVHWQQRRFGYAADSRGTQLAGAGFDAIMLEWWAPLVSGGSVHVVPDAVRADPEALVAWLQTQRISHSFLPTPLAEALMQERWPAESTLKVVLTGGDRLRRTPPRGLPFTLYNNYGPTEAGVVATSMEVMPASGGGRLPAIGRAIDGVRLQVLDGSQRPVPVGVVGELYLGGAGVARGYRGDAPGQSEGFLPGTVMGLPADERVYRTGDRVRYLADGTLEFIGRQDDQVKLRGHRVELGEIEAVLSSAPGVQAAVVAARTNQLGELQIEGWVVAPSGYDSDAVDALLRARLPVYMIPAQMHRVQALPVTASGKHDLPALLAMTPLDEGQMAAAPATSMEEVVAGIWGELLGVDVDDVHQSFFALGGHSLLATRAAARLSQALARDVAVHMIFAEPTIRGLARALEADRWQSLSPPPPLVAAQRVPGHEHISPQSSAQQRMWFLEQLDPGTPTYHVHSALSLVGALDGQMLAKAFSELVQRHEVLRTTLRMNAEGQLVQAVQPHVAFHLASINLAGLEPGQLTARTCSLVEEEIRQPFDLENGPLLRASLIRLDDEHHLLVIGLHHAIIDGWSMDTLQRELSELYRAATQGEAARLPVLNVQYGDYARWQSEWIDFGVLEELLFYWKEQLHGAPTELPLPRDHLRERRTRAGGLVGLALDQRQRGALERHARQAGTTTFVVLLAAFKALLARYCGCSDLVVGVPFANRGRAELDSMLGLFVNTLPLRSDLSGDPDFATIVQRVRTTTLGALAHQDLPLERLIDRLSPQRRWQPSPLFNVLFVLQDDAGTGLQLRDIQVEELALPHSTAKFDLTLSIGPSVDGLQCWFEYSTDVLAQATVERMARHFGRLLEQALAQPRQPLSGLALLDPGEQAQLQQWGAGEPAAVRDDVCTQFQAQAARTPAALAVADDSTTLDYAGLDAASGRVAAHLSALGVGRGAVVALALPRSVALCVAQLAVLKVGAAFMPLDLQQPRARMWSTILDAKVAAVLGLNEEALEAPADAPRCVLLERDAAVIAGYAPLPATAVTPADLAYVIHTSGSSGKPKGVEVEHRALSSLVHWQQRRFGYAADSRGTQLAGAGFDAIMLEWWAPLVSGGSVHVVPDAVRADPEALVAWLQTQRISHSFLPTPLAEALMQERWPAESTLKVVLTGGDRLRRTPPRGLPFTLYNNYGPTEAGVVATSMEVMPASGGGRLPAIGRAIDGVRLQVLDGSQRPVPVGVVGELYLGGAGVARGYRGDAPGQSEGFLPGTVMGLPADERVYRTGDRVRYLADGTLEFIGRQDDQVKLRGHRVELGEIEAVAGQHPCIEACAATGVVQPDGQSRLVLHVQGRRELDLQELKTWLLAHSPRHMVPDHFTTIDALPLNSAGKIDRKALARVAEQGHTLSVARDDHVAPANDTERRLAAIWEAMLEVQPVSVEDDFFQLGGNSLNVLSMRSEIRTQFAVDIDLAVLLEQGTVRAIAARIVDAQQRSGLMAAPVADEKVPVMGGIRRLLQRLQRRQGGVNARGDSGVLRALSDSTAAGTPLVCVHSIGGSVWCYRQLGEALSADRPVLGLELCPDVFAQGTSIPELAARHNALLDRQYPDGDYILCGWSIGGVIAFEMARQRTLAGGQARPVMLLDSYPFSHATDNAALTDNELLDGLSCDIAASVGRELLPDMFAKARIDDHADPVRQMLAALRDLRMLSDDYDEAAFRRLLANYTQGYRAWCEYTPVPYEGALHLLVCAGSIDTFGKNPVQSWNQLGRGGMAIEVMPCSHYGLLTTQHARKVAVACTSLFARGCEHA